MPRYDSIDQLPSDYREQAAEQIAPNNHVAEQAIRELKQRNWERINDPKSDGKRAVTVQEVGVQGDNGRFRYEHDLQAAVFNWADNNIHQYPELALMYAIPNGGHRYKSVAAKLKKEGVRAGVPDVHLPVARNGYHSLYIELKVGKNKPTAKQQGWLTALREQGHKTAVCRDLASVQALIVSYLKGDGT